MDGIGMLLLLVTLLTIPFFSALRGFARGVWRDKRQVRGLSSAGADV